MTLFTVHGGKFLGNTGRSLINFIVSVGLKFQNLCNKKKKIYFKRTYILNEYFKTFSAYS